MTRRDGSPPDRVGGDPSHEAASRTNCTQTTAENHPDGCRQSNAAPMVRSATPLRRRRRAADRCEPLHDGTRDPWRVWRPKRMSAKHVQAAAAAARHLFAVGLTPLFDADTLEQLREAS